MTIYSSNYPIPHEVSEGVYEISETDCDENQRVIMRGRTMTGINEFEVDIAETAKYNLGLDDITIPTLESGLNQLSPISFSVTSVAYGNGIYVAVGGTYMATSPDGFTWSTRRLGLYAITGICFADGIFVACYTYGVYISTDGINWETIPTEVTNWRGISYVNGTFILLAYSGWIGLSVNGTSWTFQTVGAAHWNSCIYVGGLYVMVGNSSYVATSTDLINWSVKAVSGAGDFIDITYGLNTFVIAVSSTYSAVYVSTDGITWTHREVGSYGSNTSILYNDGLFFLTTNVGYVITSSDLINWSVQQVSRAQLSDIIFANGRYFIGGYGGSYAHSADGIDWDFYSFYVVWSAITYGSGKYVAVGGKGHIATSADGTSWTLQELDIASSGINDVIYVNDLFVATCVRGHIVTSNDGINWTITKPLTDNLRSIAYGNGLYVVTGSQGTIWTSSDLVTWNTILTGLSSALYAVTYSDGLFVAVGTVGACLTSSDGIEWIVRTTGIGSAIRDVVYGNGLFVAAGDSGSILTSPDGVDWTIYRFEPYPSFQCIYFNNAQNTFYFASNRSGIWHTKDFEEFGMIESVESLHGIYSEGSILIVVGDYYIYARTVNYGTYVQDAGLVKDFYINNNPWIYTIGYNYNTDYISDLGSSRLNTDPINNEFVNGQYVTLSVYDEVCDNPKTITAYLNGASLSSDTTSARAVQYWFDTVFIEAVPGDVLTLTLTDSQGNEYSVDYKCSNACVRYILYYVNKYGALDCLILKGEVIEQFSNDQYIINKHYDRSLDYSFQRKVISNTIEKVYNCNTGALLNDQADKIDHLLSSPKVWIHDLEKLTIRAAVIDTTNYQIRTTKTDNDMPSYSFNLLQSQDVIRRG